jgi:hypothetical protein
LTRTRRVIQIWALLLALGLAGTLIWRALPQRATIPGSDLTFERPSTWHEADLHDLLDPAWESEQKRNNPADAALIDSLVDGVRAGDITYSAWIDIDETDPEIDGWIKSDVSTQDDAMSPPILVAYARSSVDRQPVRVRPDTTAIEVRLPGGTAARLDWSFDLSNADGSSDVTHVRSYWMSSGSSLVVVQLTTYGDFPEAVAVFDATATTFRWAAATSSRSGDVSRDALQSRPDGSRTVTDMLRPNLGRTTIDAPG